MKPPDPICLFWLVVHAILYLLQVFWAKIYPYSCILLSLLHFNHLQHHEHRWKVKSPSSLFLSTILNVSSHYQSNLKWSIAFGLILWFWKKSKLFNILSWQKLPQTSHLFRLQSSWWPVLINIQHDFTGIKEKQTQGWYSFGKEQ